MRSSRLIAAATAAVAAGTVLMAPQAVAAPNDRSAYGDIATYCADVQSELARIKPGSVEINNVIVDENSTETTASGAVRTGYAVFRSSKALVDGPTRTITVRQWVVRDAAGNPLQVMCKTKSQDALVAALGADTFSGAPAQCSDVVNSILGKALPGLPGPARAAATGNLARTVVDATEYDDLGGNLWTVRGYETIVDGADGKLHLRSQGLFTPADRNTPLSDAFVDWLNANYGPFGYHFDYGVTNGQMVDWGLTDPLTLGVHYCTVPSTWAVRQALLG